MESPLRIKHGLRAYSTDYYDEKLINIRLMDAQLTESLSVQNIKTCTLNLQVMFPLGPILTAIKRPLSHVKEFVEIRSVRSAGNFVVNFLC